MSALWGEGQPFSKSQIYDVNSIDEKRPPVHYNSYTLKPHSLPHVDAPGHIISGGCGIDLFYQNNQLSGFYGKVAVVKLKGNKFKRVDESKSSYHWEVTLDDLKTGLSEIGLHSPTRLCLYIGYRCSDVLGRKW
jgi:kynurenine formamidase